jgi:hypothetical protein
MIAGVEYDSSGQFCMFFWINKDFFFNYADRFTALRFTATGAPLAARRIRIFHDELVCLMSVNFWNGGKQVTCGPHGGFMSHGVQYG